MYGYVVLRRDAVVRVICEWLSVGDSACLLVFSCVMCSQRPELGSSRNQAGNRKNIFNGWWLVTHGFTSAMVYFSLPHSCLTLRLARRYSEKYVLMCHWSLWHESGMFFAQHVNHTINRPLAKLYITADAILRLDRTVNPLPRIGFLLWCPLPSTAWFCVRVCLFASFCGLGYCWSELSSSFQNSWTPFETRQ